MNRDDVPLSFPCGKSFAEMKRADGGRLCTDCNTVVRDLSSMNEDAARALLDGRETSRLCVRYLYDVDGRVVFAGDPDVARAKIVPAYRLGAKARARIAQAALLVAPLVLFEACGGNGGEPRDYTGTQAEDAAVDHVAAEPQVADDAGADAAPDAPDAAVDAGTD